MINNKVKRQLDAIDWDFPARHPGVTKLAHWYPGTFPSQLPATFIQSLTSPNDLVFDPYGGVGTTASEAIRLGRKAWVVDLNPVGMLANYAYCALLLLKSESERKLNLFFDCIEGIVAPTRCESLDLDLSSLDYEVLKLDEFFGKHMRPAPEAMLDLARVRDEVNWEAMERWFHPGTLQEVKEMQGAFNERSHASFLRLFFQSMLSANMRALCSQNKSWGHIADNVYPKEFVYKSPVLQFQKWMKSLKNNLDKVNLEGDAPKGIRYWAGVHNWASRARVSGRPRNGVGLILTSPPYGDAIDYINAQKLSLFLLGYKEQEISELCRMEIGARRKRFKPGSREAWATQMSEAAIKQCEYLDDGLFVAILPHKNHGREIGLNTMVKKLKEVGFERVFEVDRSIDQKRTRQSWTSIKQETISVFSKT